MNPVRITMRREPRGREGEDTEVGEATETDEEALANEG
jgi:hypothetical protein